MDNFTFSNLDVDSIYRRKSLMCVDFTSAKVTLPSFTSKPNFIHTQIFLKPLVGDSQSMFVVPSMTVLELKQAIYAKFGCNIKTTHLTFSGKQLEDHRTLTDYKIQKGFCIIQVLYRALGGINFCVIS